MVYGTNLAADGDFADNRVYIEDEQGGHLAARYLVDLGHKEIRFIGDPKKRPSAVCVRMLCKLIDYPGTAAELVVLSTQLIVRRSTCGHGKELLPFVREVDQAT